MSDWKATMPKGKPGPGKVDVVLAIRENGGYRCEVTMCLPLGYARDLWKYAMATEQDYSVKRVSEQ